MEDKNKLITQIRILRCQIGDKEAFVELISQYQEPLRYFIENLMQDSKTAEDIIQETWLTVIRKIRTLKEPTAFAPWLYRIARNYCYGKFRQKHLSIPLDDDIDIPCTMANDEPFYEDITKLHMCLPKLNPVHKEVLILRFLENMSYQEISLITGSNIGTVKSRIYFAKKALKKEMEK